MKINLSLDKKRKKKIYFFLYEIEKYITFLE